ncbi:hypothetical protein VNI00_015628 [Paramarasmius palmivorus]|uniref:Epidermal growth factor receptor-like transmembrane-juxtamembrane segment domain-containing protein n=1 Tax=Paramarasmius palmivorus TaxID=297713 RepID=A0AAW0BBP8_9AGAR
MSGSARGHGVGSTGRHSVGYGEVPGRPPGAGGGGFDGNVGASFTVSRSLPLGSSHSSLVPDPTNEHSAGYLTTKSEQPSFAASVTPQVPSSSLTTNTSTAPNHSMIIGATVGSITCLLLVVISFVIYRRRHQSKRRTSQNVIHQPDDVMSPYPLEIPVREKTRARDKEQRLGLPENLDSEEEPRALGLTSVEEHRRAIPLVPEPQPTPIRQGRFRQHQDSGWRPPPPPSESGMSGLIDVPPQYENAV